MAKDKLVGLTPKDQLIATIQQRLNGRPPDIDAALLIAVDAFFDHKDRNGRPYTTHLLQVYRTGTDSSSKIIVGLLHDLIEDTVWTLEDLRHVGFPGYVVDAIDFVTKRPNERYFDGVVRCGTSINRLPQKHKFLAIDAKLADLRHNMDVSRETGRLSPEYQERLAIYNVAYNFLVALKKGDIVADCSITGFMDAYPDLYNPDLLRKNSSDPERAMLFPRRPATTDANAAPS